MPFSSKIIASCISKKENSTNDLFPSKESVYEQEQNKVDDNWKAIVWNPYLMQH